MSAETPRIPPGSRRDLGLFGWGFTRLAGRVAGTEPPNLFTTLGRHRGLFRGWLWFAGRLMPGGRLPRRDTEIVILRVAHLRECRYEHEHHVRLGRRAGLGPVDLERIAAGPDAPGWSERERTILRAVDELDRGRRLGDETWEQLQSLLDERALIELVMLVAHYEMLATFIAALRIQPDARDPARPTGPASKRVRLRG